MKTAIHCLVLFIIAIIIHSQPVYGQETQILSLKEFLSVVIKYHPVVRQAHLINKMAEEQLRASGGQFDPMISYRLQDKEFENKKYYRLQNLELNIPTWYGIDLNLTALNNTGPLINPQSTPDLSQQIGFNLPLMQGLLMDQRRKSVLQSKQMLKMAESERILIVNDLLLEAITVYAEWVLCHQQKMLLDSLNQVNELRYNLIQISIGIGEMAPIDTIEALSQWQIIKAQQIEADQKLELARIRISNFLWLQDGSYYQLPAGIIPSDQIFPKVNTSNFEYYLSASDSHPEIKQAVNEIKMAELEKKYRFQFMLPRADLSIQNLSRSFQFGTGAYALKNSLYSGIQFELPLFLRSGRGNYRRAKLELNVRQLNLERINVKIKNDIKMEYTKNKKLILQSETLAQATRNLETMLQAENTKYQNGESSLFIVNQRELRFLESRKQLLILNNQVAKSSWQLQHLIAGLEEAIQFAAGNE
ncbi:MAG: TolC family protein [Saprospiraceae bacterium]|nr:TolC family protein [Saprospiraceae bacterium]